MGSPRPPAAPAPTIIVEHLIDVLGECARHVFTTMVHRPLQCRAEFEDESVHLGVVGTVGFAGSHSGLVVFSTTYAGALDITTGLLGLDATGAPPASRDEVADAVGEVANMIAGSFRTRMAVDRDAWAITVPTVTMGSDFYIKPMTSSRRASLSFRMAGHEVLVELIVTQNAGRR
jgi:chemotaxis protein CheX